MVSSKAEAYIWHVEHFVNPPDTAIAVMAQEIGTFCDAFIFINYITVNSKIIIFFSPACKLYYKKRCNRIVGPLPDLPL